MIRRTFRIGMMVGLLTGAVLALLKATRRRHDEVVADDPWAPLPPPSAEPVRTPAATMAPFSPPAVEPVLEPAVEPTATHDELVAEVTETTEPARERQRPLRVAKVPSSRAAAKKSTKRAAKSATPAKTVEKAAPPQPWVAPDGGICPTTHPVKAKLSSRIFHLPGGLNYGRTKPDRCYRSAEEAEGEGLRAAKR
ncbi:hypothetical protein BH24ACT3_BH24ACT3_11810 [soil metagenome]